MHQIATISAGVVADDGDTERVHGDEYNADRGVFFQALSARQPTDAERRDQARDEATKEQIGACRAAGRDIADGHARKDAMAEGVAKERHATNDDKAADHTAD